MYARVRSIVDRCHNKGTYASARLCFYSHAACLTLYYKPYIAHAWVEPPEGAVGSRRFAFNGRRLGLAALFIIFAS